MFKTDTQPYSRVKENRPLQTPNDAKPEPTEEAQEVSVNDTCSTAKSSVDKDAKIENLSKELKTA